MNSLLPQIKYHQNPVALGWLSEVFARWLISDLETPPQALAYVPMRPWRALLRGFNQSELLCRALSQKLGIPVLEGALKKIRSTPRQMTLDAEARQHNLLNAFYAQGELPRHVALIDDICTTGSTAEAIAQALKMAGCEVVEVWVLARTPQPRHLDE